VGSALHYCYYLATILLLLPRYNLTVITSLQPHCYYLATIFRQGINFQVTLDLTKECPAQIDIDYMYPSHSGLFVDVNLDGLKIVVCLPTI
jgi:hypothetical protein